MNQSAGLDVSVKETAICIVDEVGQVVRETKVVTEPEAIITLLNSAGVEYERIGLGVGPLSQWLGRRRIIPARPAVLVAAA
jgi:transposase